MGSKNITFYTKLTDLPNPIDLNIPIGGRGIDSSTNILPRVIQDRVTGHRSSAPCTIRNEKSFTLPSSHHFGGWVALCNHEVFIYRFIVLYFISFHFTSFHFISFNFISFRFISFHFISFNSDLLWKLCHTVICIRQVF